MTISVMVMWFFSTVIEKCTQNNGKNLKVVTSFFVSEGWKENYILTYFW